MKKLFTIILLTNFLILNYSCVSVVPVPQKELNRKLIENNYIPPDKKDSVINFRIDGNYLVGNIDLKTILEEKKYDVKYKAITRLGRDSKGRLLDSFGFDGKDSLYWNSTVKNPFWWIFLPITLPIMSIDWISTPFKTGKESNINKEKIEKVTNKIDSINSPDFFIQEDSKWNITNGVFKIPLDYFISNKIEVLNYSLLYKNKALFEDKLRLRDTSRIVGTSTQHKRLVSQIEKSIAIRDKEEEQRKKEAAKELAQKKVLCDRFMGVVAKYTPQSAYNIGCRNSCYSSFRGYGYRPFWWWY
ncbi:MAG: hypothetical protein H7A23_02910 [Leptospiraceae bacterium]|nr:hypothetical protein [Leptospiraceae bacterium]